MAGIGSAATARPAKPRLATSPCAPGQNRGQAHLHRYGRRPVPSDLDGRMVLRWFAARTIWDQYFDMAHSYAMDSRRVYGKCITPFRKDIFLTTKAGNGQKGSRRGIKPLVKSMRTDHVDLWQMHGVNICRKWSRFSARRRDRGVRGGEEGGKCRFIGLLELPRSSGPCRHAQARGEFDTALMPLHVADTSYSDSPAMSFIQTALPAAIERGSESSASRFSGTPSCCGRSARPTA